MIEPSSLLPFAVRTSFGPVSLQPVSSLNLICRITAYRRAVHSLGWNAKFLSSARQNTTGEKMGAKSNGFHVALVIPSLRIGGAERSTLRIARGLVERGHRVDVVLLGNINSLQHEVPSGARILHLTDSGSHSEDTSRNRIRAQEQVGFSLSFLLKRNYVRNSIRIGAYIDDERPDFVLPALPGAKIATLLCATRTEFKPRIVPIFRNHILKRSWKERRLLAKLLESASHTIAVSDGVAESIKSHLSVPDEKVTRIYNPVVVPETLRLAEQPPDHPWFLESDIPIVLGAGRLGRVKDFPTLLRAFAITARKRPARLIILGDGTWRRRLESLVRRLDLVDSVSLTGWVANPYSFMSRASAFLLSSRYEGLPNVLIEALSCGCPCASTDCPSGPREILDHGCVGPLVPVGDHVALSEALDRLLTDPPNTDIVLTHAQRFAFPRSISQYEKLLHNVGNQESIL